MTISMLVVVSEPPRKPAKLTLVVSSFFNGTNVFFAAGGGLVKTLQ